MFLAEQPDDDLADGLVVFTGRCASVPRVPIASRRLELLAELARLLEGLVCENKTNLISSTKNIFCKRPGITLAATQSFFDGIDS